MGVLGFGSGPLGWIAGPCVLESLEMGLQTAIAVREHAERHGLNAVFKASVDKANRTSAGSARGVGLKEALPVFAEIRETERGETDGGSVSMLVSPSDAITR